MLISVRVHPKAPKSGVTGFSGGAWQVKVSAPPVKEKANTELVALLGQILDVGKSNISIVRGHTSRSKIIAIEGLTEKEITTRLSSSAASRE